MIKKLMLCCVLLVHSSIVMADVYNVGTDWAGSTNPNGVWAMQSVYPLVDPVTNPTGFNDNRALFAGYYAPGEVFYWAQRTEVGRYTLRPDNAVSGLAAWTAPEAASCAITGSLQSPAGQDDILFQVLYQDVSAGTITELWSGTTTAGGAALTWDVSVIVDSGDEILFYMPAGAYGQGSTNGNHPWEAGMVTEPPPPPAGTLIVIQ